KRLSTSLSSIATTITTHSVIRFGKSFRNELVRNGRCTRRNVAMTTDFERETLDDAFNRVRGLDASLQDQLRTFADTVRRERPEFAAAVDRLVRRLRQYGAGESAPKVGEPMPPFVLPDDNSQMVSLEELLNGGSVAVTFHRGHWCPYCR